MTEKRKILVILMITVPFLLIYSCSGSSPDHNNSLKIPGNIQTQVLTKSVNKELIVGLQPLGDFETELQNLEKKEIESFYHMKCIVLPAIPLPDRAFYRPWNRYRADSLVNFLESYRRSVKIDFIVGLAELDISCTKEPYEDYGIFGLANMPGHACVVSAYAKRLGIKASRDLLKERLTKVVLHELGHNFGLDHCSTPNCLMEDAKGTRLIRFSNNFA
jgi:archaemetzincin